MKLIRLLPNLDFYTFVIHVPYIRLHKTLVLEEFLFLHEAKEL